MREVKSTMVLRTKATRPSEPLALTERRATLPTTQARVLPPNALQPLRASLPEETMIPATSPTTMVTMAATYATVEYSVLVTVVVAVLVSVDTAVVVRVDVAVEPL
jgi:hypothetical protein